MDEVLIITLLSKPRFIQSVLKQHDKRDDRETSNRKCAGKMLVLKLSLYTVV